jgi:hypothetical protein
VTIADLDEARLRALRLALNRLSEDSRWDLEALRLEFSDIMEISGEIDLRISGFEMGEIDAAVEGNGVDEEDDLPALNETSPPVTKPGDLWLLGDHRILCANALISELCAASRKRAGRDDLYRSAVEHSDRRPCLGARSHQAR